MTTATAMWPVALTEGLAPWYEASDPITAALGPPQVGPAAARLACIEWTAVAGTVTCTALTGEGYLPAVGYSTDSRYVVISTLHADSDIATYANSYSHGKDVGYDAAPLPLTDVVVSRWPGKLVEAANGTRRVTIEPTPGTLVAVEVGGGLSRADLLTIAAGVRPTTATPSIPLVIARSAPGADGTVVTALGGVKDGELCLLTDAGCTSLGDKTLLTQEVGQSGLVGLAADQVGSLAVTAPDGTSADVRLDRAAIGPVRAFAIGRAPGSAVEPRDASGSPISAAEGSVVTVPPAGGTNEPVPTTSAIVETVSPSPTQP